MKRATSNYLKRVSDVAKEGFSSVEEKNSCLENVFAELEDEGLVVCQSPETSLIVEEFITLATAENLKVLLIVLKKDIETVLKDRFASHVLESILLRSTKLIEGHVLEFEPLKTIEVCNEDLETHTDDFEKPEYSLTSMILSLCEIVGGEIKSYLTDSYSSHVLRTLLQVIGGTSVEFKINGQKKGPKKDTQAPKFKDFDVPVLFRKKLKSFGKCLFQIERLDVLLMDTHASTVIQIFLLVCHKVDDVLCQKYIKKLIRLAQISEENDGQNENLPPVAKDKVGSFLVQQIISLASSDVYQRLFVRLFKGKMLQFAIHPKCNFILQSLLESCTDKEIFKEQFDELQNHLEDVLAYGHYGVIVALVKTCQRLDCGQKPVKQQLMAALHCRDPQPRQKTIALLMLTLRTYEMYYNLPEDEGQNNEKDDKEEHITQIPFRALDGANISYFGSMLLQEMLQFNGTQLIVDSLLDLRTDDLSMISCNSFGSYVLEKFFHSKTVSKTAKDSLINNLKSKSIDIACHRIGCQTIQSLWGLLNLAQKSSLSEELCKDEIKVRSDQYGKYVYSNLALQHFKKRPKDWDWIQQQEGKKRKLFNEFIGPGISSKKMGKGSDFTSEDDILKIESDRDNQKDDSMSQDHSEGNQNSYVFDRTRESGGRPFMSRGRGDFNSRGGYRGRGGYHSRGGSRGRGDFDSMGGSRGRGDNSDRYNTRGDIHDQGEGGRRGRDNFRGRFSGRGDNRGRGKRGFFGNSQGDNETGKSGSI